MPLKMKSPAGGTAGPFGNVAVGTADAREIPLQASARQTARLRERFGLTPAVAAATAALAYPATDTWAARS